VSEKILGRNRCAKQSPFHTEVQPPRMHGPGLWRYEQKEHRKKTSVPMSGANCDIWCPRWESKDIGGRLEQKPRIHLQSRAPIRIMIRCWGTAGGVGYIKHVGRYVSTVQF